MGTLIFNRISSAAVGLVVEHPPNYQTPEKDYEVIHVPGRNGDVLIDKGSYQNVERSYEVAFGSLTKHHSEMAAAVSEWLHSATGYARLEDTYEPDYYRMASYQEATELENLLDHLGRATITFNCKPQRWLKSGEKPISLLLPMYITNPTKFEALPSITIRSAPETVLLNVNETEIELTFDEDTPSITIDSNIQEAYMRTGSETRPGGAYDILKNNSIKLLSGGFPTLKSGANEISWSGSLAIESVEVIPRWWTL